MDEYYAELNGQAIPNWKKVYEDYAKFRGEENVWFRFTEATIRSASCKRQKL